MNSKIQEIADFIVDANPASVDQAIGDCVAHGFSPVLIMAGIQFALKVPPADAKKLVWGHPSLRHLRTEWKQSIDEFARTIEADT